MDSYVRAAEMKEGRLVLYPQGGVGNQIIQTAYVYSLALDTGKTFSFNPALLSKALSRIRGVTYRQECLFLSEYGRISSKVGPIGGILQLKLARLAGSLLTDRTSHRRITERLEVLHENQKILFYGYFQRRQAFEGSSASFWKQLSRRVAGKHSSRFGDCVGIHVRMGDYLQAGSGGMYEICDPVSLVSRGLLLRSELGLRKPLNIFTDSPALFKEVVGPNLLGECNLMIGKSDIEEFCFLSGHRFIIGSNSTFSLCAIRLAHEIWRGHSHGIIPRRWYKDEYKNNEIMKEISSSSYWSYA